MTFPFSVRGRSVIVWTANNLLLVLHLDDLFNRGERIKVFLSIQISTPLAIIYSAFTEGYSYYLMQFFFCSQILHTKYFCFRESLQTKTILEEEWGKHFYYAKSTEWKCAHKRVRFTVLLSFTQISLTTALHAVLGSLDGQELLFQ